MAWLEAWDVLCENTRALAAPVFHAGVRALLGSYTTFQDIFFRHCQNKYLRIPGQPLRCFHNQLGTASAPGLSTY